MFHESFGVNLIWPVRDFVIKALGFNFIKKCVVA